MAYMEFRTYLVVMAYLVHEFLVIMAYMEFMTYLVVVAYFMAYLVP
jgi:hypothetical protein